MSKKIYTAIIGLVVIIGVVLRFWDLPNRVVVYADSARDAIFAKEALLEGKIPVIGPFSSCGPFVFGPIYFWYLMAAYLVMPAVSLAPWYATAFLSVVTLLLLIDSGRRTNGKAGGIITALIAAFSPAQIFRSMSVTPHSLVGVSIAAVLWSTLVYAEKKTWKYIFLMGLAVGIAISLHYQALSLVVMGGIIFLLPAGNFKKILRHSLVYLGGIVLPFIPLFYWDMNQGWANLRNLMDFIFIGQYRIFVSRRWLSFITDFLPKTVSEIVGGDQAMVWVTLGLGAVAVWSLVKTRRLTKEVIWINLVLALQIIVIRYARVDLYEGYLVFLHPLVIFVVGWIIAQVTKLKYWRYAASIVLVGLIVGSVVKDVGIISRRNNFVTDVDSVIDQIVRSRPNQKFVLYDHIYASGEFSYALSFLLSRRQLLETNGAPLAVCLWECPKGSGKEITTVKMGNHYVISDLSATEAATLKPPVWYDVSPKNVLQEMGFWWQEKPLKSTFSIRKFLLGTLLRKNL